MSLIPWQVVKKGIQASPAPDFSWDGEEDPNDAIGEVSDAYIAEFGQLNPIAAVAYGLACVEWIYWFVREHLDPRTAALCEADLAALWAWETTLPRKDGIPGFLSEDGERTTWKDAVDVGLDSVRESISSVPDGESAVDAAFLTQLCEHVLPAKSGFEPWRHEVFARLKTQFPADTHYDKVSVPRDMFETGKARK